MNFYNKTPSELKVGDQIVLGRSPYKVVAIKWRELSQDWEISYGSSDKFCMFLICKSENELTLVKK